jgi:uncharacterized protein (DUF1810 family)
MTDPFELQRFVDAQTPAYTQVMSELRSGRKRSHWMWFIFRKSPALDTAQWRVVMQSHPATKPRPT